MYFYDSTTGEMIGSLDIGFMVFPVTAFGIAALSLLYFPFAAQEAEGHDRKWIARHIGAPLIAMVLFNYSLFAIGLLSALNGNQTPQNGEPLVLLFLIIILTFLQTYIGCKTYQCLSLRSNSNNSENIFNKHAKHAKGSLEEHLEK